MSSGRDAECEEGLHSYIDKMPEFIPAGYTSSLYFAMCKPMEIRLKVLYSSQHDNMEQFSRHILVRTQLVHIAIYVQWILKYFGTF